MKDNNSPSCQYFDSLCQRFKSTKFYNFVIENKFISSILNFIFSIFVLFIRFILFPVKVAIVILLVISVLKYCSKDNLNYDYFQAPNKEIYTDAEYYDNCSISVENGKITISGSCKNLDVSSLVKNNLNSNSKDQKDKTDKLDNSSKQDKDSKESKKSTKTAKKVNKKTFK